MGSNLISTCSGKKDQMIISPNNDQVGSEKEWNLAIFDGRLGNHPKRTQVLTAVMCYSLKPTTDFHNMDRVIMMSFSKCYLCSVCRGHVAQYKCNKINSACVLLQFKLQNNPETCTVD